MEQDVVNGITLIDFIKKYGKEKEYLYHEIIKICEEDLNKGEKIIYGYDLVEGTKFEMSIEELCRINNCEDGLNSNCYIYTTEEDRDLHLSQVGKLKLESM